MAELGASPFSITATAAYTIPLGVTSLQVECRGGGASGSPNGSTTARPGGGGGGGAYSKRAAIRVIPSKSYTFTVGATVAGSASNNGNPSTFTGEDAVTCTAAGGTSTADRLAGPGGTVAASIGDAGAIFAGGAGGAASNTSDYGGAGGGEGGRSGATGGAGSANTTSTGGAGGTGGDGGDGGPGGNNASAGTGGVAPGGGGGGAGGTNNVSGGGAQGEIIVTYTKRTYCGFGGGVAATGSMGF